MHVLPVPRTLGTRPWFGGRLPVSRAGTDFDEAGGLLTARQTAPFQWQATALLSPEKRGQPDADFSFYGELRSGLIGGQQRCWRLLARSLMTPYSVQHGMGNGFRSAAGVLFEWTVLEPAFDAAVGYPEA